MADGTVSHKLNAPFRFDLESAPFKRDPLPTFAAMRKAGPLIPLKLPFVGRAWVTTTHASTIAMVKVLRSDGLFKVSVATPSACETTTRDMVTP